MSAGLELFGTDGYSRVSVKQICDRAGLTQRYFYESFDDRESLLTAVYDRIVTEIGARTLAAIARGGSTIDELAHVALTEFIAHLTDDRRCARVMLIEIIGVSPGLDERRRRVIHDFADLIVDAGMAHAGEQQSRPGFRLAAVGMVGAVNQLLTDWVLGHGETDPSEIESVCTRIFAATFVAFAAD